jgi:hypothetical protein
MATSWPGPIVIGALSFKAGWHGSGPHQRFLGIEDLTIVVWPVQQMPDGEVADSWVQGIRFEKPR